MKHVGFVFEQSEENKNGKRGLVIYTFNDWTERRSRGPLWNTRIIDPDIALDNTELVIGVCYNIIDRSSDHF